MSEKVLFGEKMKRIRSAGLRTEKKFFGPRGVFAKAGHTKHLQRNPLTSFNQLPVGQIFVFQGELDHPTWQTVKGPWVKTGRFHYKHVWDERHTYRVGKSSTKVYPVSLSDKGVLTKNPISHKAALSCAEKIVEHEKESLKVPQWIEAKTFDLWKKQGTIRVTDEGEENTYGVDEFGHTFFKKNPITIVGNPGRPHGKFRSCVKQVSRKPLPPGSDPKAICGAALNPPNSIHAEVAGVLYNRCIEIRAEKTTPGKLQGLYYHPFKKDSKVCILALDNGDLLIHSKAGHKLWKVD